VIRHSPGMTAAATSSFSRSGMMNGTKPVASAPDRPIDGLDASRQPEDAAGEDDREAAIIARTAVT